MQIGIFFKAFSVLCQKTQLPKLTNFGLESKLAICTSPTWRFISTMQTRLQYSILLMVTLSLKFHPMQKHTYAVPVVWIGKRKMYKLRTSAGGRKFEFSSWEIALAGHFIVSFIDGFSECMWCQQMRERLRHFVTLYIECSNSLSCNPRPYSNKLVRTIHSV